jgi:hypothetical protein
MPIFYEPRELASLQSGKKFRGKGSSKKNATRTDDKKEVDKFIMKCRLDIDASWRATEEWRREAEESYDFVENNQWDPKDVAFIKSESPTRPILTFNDILPIVRILSGIERQKKENFKIWPREGGDVDSAALLTQLIGYVDDENLGFYQRIRKSNDVTICGRGYIKTDITYEENVNGDITVKRRNPFTIFNDAMAEEWDGTDRKWVGEGEWVDEGEAKELWPEFAEQIKVGEWLSSTTGTMPANLTGDRLANIKLFLDQATKRVRIFDYWYKQRDTATLVVNLDTGDVVELDEEFRELYQTMAPQSRQSFNFVRRPITTVRVATFCNWLLLQDKVSPFDHRFFPITPYIGIQFLNEPNGLVKYLKDPARLKNKAISQGLNHLNRSANSGWMNHASEGAAPGTLEKFGSAPGVEITYKSIKPEQIRPVGLSTGHFTLAQLGADQIKNTSLINAEIQGLGSQRTISGKAIQARQQGGLVGNEDLTDNALLGDKLVGVQLISLVQQVITPLRAQRIVENVAVRNKESPIAQLMARKKNELPGIIDAALKEEYDYIIDKAGGFSSAREELAAKLTDLAGKWASTGQPVPVSLIKATIQQLDIPEGLAAEIQNEIAAMAQGIPPGAAAGANGAVT